MQYSVLTRVRVLYALIDFNHDRTDGHAVYNIYRFIEIRFRSYRRHYLKAEISDRVRLYIQTRGIQTIK